MADGTKRLVEAIRKSQKAPAFDEDRYVKKWAASAFWHDGAELLERSRLMHGWGQERRSKAFKLFVDLIMSVECALKSLIISSSKLGETPEDAYTKARAQSHFLERLANEAIRRDAQLRAEIDLELLRDADKVGVHSRYGIEALRLLSTETTEDRFFSKGAYSRVLDDKWLKKFAIQAQIICKVALNSMNEKLPMADLRSGAEIRQADIRLTKFKTTVFN